MQCKMWNLSGKDDGEGELWDGVWFQLCSWSNKQQVVWWVLSSDAVAVEERKQADAITKKNTEKEQ